MYGACLQANQEDFEETCAVDKRNESSYLCSMTSTDEPLQGRNQLKTRKVQHSKVEPKCGTNGLNVCKLIEKRFICHGLHVKT